MSSSTPFNISQQHKEVAFRDEKGQWPFKKARKKQLEKYYGVLQSR